MPDFHEGWRREGQELGDLVYARYAGIWRCRLCDAASATLTSQALEEVIHWQQATLKEVLGKPLSDIPQQWVMYKEVPGYWANGMNVSDDVTLLWSDDNRGNIRRIPIGK